MGEFGNGFIRSLESPLNFGLYLVIGIIFVLSVYFHFMVWIKIGDSATEVKKNLSVTSHSDDIKSHVEKYFSDLALFKNSKKITVVETMDFVRSMSSVLIILGVLGTFISLVISLSGLQGIFSAENGMNSAEIDNILQAMSVAFYTSILGMLGSLILNVLSKSFNTEHRLTRVMYQTENDLQKTIQLEHRSQIEEQEERINKMATEGLESIKRSEQNTKLSNANLTNIHSSLASFNNFTTELNQAANNMKSLNTDLDQSMGKYIELFSNVDKLMSGFEKGLSGLNSNFENLFTYFNSIDEQSRNTNIVLAELVSQSAITTSVVEKISSDVESSLELNRQISTEMKHIMPKFAEDMGSMTLDFKNLAQTSLDSLSNSISDSEKVNRFLMNDYIEQNEKLFIHLNEVKTEFKATIYDSNESLLNGVKQYKNEVEKLSNLRMNELKVPFIEMTHELDKITRKMGSNLDSNISNTIQSFNKNMKIQQTLLNHELSNIDKKVSIYTDDKFNVSKDLVHLIQNMLREIKSVKKSLDDESDKTEIVEIKS